MDSDSDDSIISVIQKFANFDIAPPPRRKMCTKCLRPVSVCWCPYLPSPPIRTTTNVIILQHPFEMSRSLSTTLMLSLSLESGRCRVIRGKRFSRTRYSDLWNTLQNQNTLLMYPGEGAEDITEIAASNSITAHNLILLDGTWAQAKAIYNQNPILKTIRKTLIRGHPPSKYVVRSQPNDACLSTLEAATFALSVLENNPQLPELLLRPLDALCDYQLQHGAMARQSKQHLIEHGLFRKKLKKSVIKKMAASNDESVLADDADHVR